MDSFVVSKEDLEIIEKQLGRCVSNVLTIGKRCIYGYPQVIKSFPLKDGKPFPTLYWLTCPYLVEEVSKLEAQQKIAEIEKMIQNDPGLKQQMIRAHEVEIEKRMKLLGEKINSLPENMIKKLKETGIGGIEDFSKIKCLHLHYASYLDGENNPAGKIVNSYISKKYCDDKRCEKWVGCGAER
ncbi:hypothetical protein HWHPT5561_07245 [Petrotoga sp. HWH.PT.55.6.1]|uniref:DUF501 domain-containing protein n=1 Tax=unclassified Petrotoga TaxID=2620614 RepID=UPI000CA05CEC|nr:MULTISPECIES: DUF501 domain-containing protein [unclassified Petrotoga]PNR91315.1 hypothetical protein X926_09160 [Petrotoga sp. HWHPT.55.6.3]RPD35510.1 hypothetical protein HWHPT5561_07245 [Petrotoga sp. HWH.PT.55.6.1]